MSAPRNLDLTEGPIWKKLLLFLLPIAAGTLFQQFYSTVDAVIVGQFVGSDALAAVGGSAAVIVQLVVGIFTGLSSGATVVISHGYGAGDKAKLHHAVHSAGPALRDPKPFPPRKPAACGAVVFQGRAWA